ncbi:MAG: hypothetical protein KY393_08865, partial [Actinobacteria bacterium]|nr:hypothetical protein [Actinomycetota bacterium]
MDEQMNLDGHSAMKRQSQYGQPRAYLKPKIEQWVALRTLMSAPISPVPSDRSLKVGVRPVT